MTTPSRIRLVPARPPARGLAAAAALAALLLAGCADPGPTHPQARSVQPQALGLQAGTTDFPADAWWQGWHDSSLDALIAQALAGNPDLQQAQARVHQAQAGAAAAGSALQPQLGASLSSVRERLSENGLYPPPFGGQEFTQNDLFVQAGFNPDVFGRNRAALEAAVGSARAAQAQAQQARTVLAAQVAGAYVGLARALAQHEVLQRTLAQRSRIAELVGKRVAAGLDTTLQERQAQTAIPQLRLQLERNAESVAEARSALAALVGAGPQATATLAPTLAELPMPELPRQLPAELLGRRADIAAARWEVQSALAGVKEARAEFYPNVNLTAMFGFDAFGATRFLQATSHSWSAGPALTLPIFEGGALRANLSAQAAAADAAIAQYNATVVGAVHEVADAVSRRASLQQQIAQQGNALELARQARALAQQRYDAGLGNEIAVLGTEDAVLQLEQTGVDLQASALLDDIGLIQALGGGYADAAPSVAAAAQP